MITSCKIKKIQETAVTVTSAIVTYRDLGRVRLRSTWLCRHHEKYIEIIIHMAHKYVEMHLEFKISSAA